MDQTVTETVTFLKRICSHQHILQSAHQVNLKSKSTFGQGKLAKARAYPVTIQVDTYIRQL